MSKITNVRLPNPQAAFSQEQFNQLIRSVEQVILQLNSTYTSTTDQNVSAANTWFLTGSKNPSVRGASPDTGLLLPYAMLMSEVDQSNAGTTSENLVEFDNVVFAKNIRVENDTEIRFDNSGQYLITISLQVTNRGNTAAEFELWAKNTGTNYPLSNTRFDVPVRKSSTIWSHVVAAVSGIFTVTDPENEYLQMAWWSDSTDVYLEHYETNTSPTRPAIPSVTLTANFISSTGG